MQEHIREGLFVPFDVILLSEQGASVDNYFLSVTPSVDVHPVMTTEQWSDAYLFFMAICIAVHPNEAPALLH